MNTSNKMKIWVLVTYALIVVGWGHGILTLLIAQFLMPVLGWLGGVGELLILYSLFTRGHGLKRITYIIGVLLLWAGIFHFIYWVQQDSYRFIAIVTVIPFALCTIISSAGGYIKNGWHWFLTKV